MPIFKAPTRMVDTAREHQFRPHPETGDAAILMDTVIDDGENIKHRIWYSPDQEAVRRQTFMRTSEMHETSPTWRLIEDTNPNHDWEEAWKPDGYLDNMPAPIRRVIEGEADDYPKQFKDQASRRLHEVRS